MIVLHQWEVLRTGEVGRTLERVPPPALQYGMFCMECLRSIRPYLMNMYYVPRPSARLFPVPFSRVLMANMSYGYLDFLDGGGPPKGPCWGTVEGIWVPEHWGLLWFGIPWATITLMHEPRLCSPVAGIQTPLLPLPFALVTVLVAKLLSVQWNHRMGLVSQPKFMDEDFRSFCNYF